MYNWLWNPHQLSKSPMLGSRGAPEDSSFSPWDSRAYSSDSPNCQEEIHEKTPQKFHAKEEKKGSTDLVLTGQSERLVCHRLRGRQIFEDNNQLTERKAPNHVSKGRVEHRKGLKIMFFFKKRFRENAKKTGCQSLWWFDLDTSVLRYLFWISAHQRGKVRGHDAQDGQRGLLFQKREQSCKQLFAFWDQQERKKLHSWIAKSKHIRKCTT